MSARPDLPGLNGDDEPVFAEPWQAQTFAMTVALNESGALDWTDWAQRLGDTLKREPDYWHAWLDTLQSVLADRNIADAEAVASREAEWHAAAARTPHGRPIEL